MKTAQRSILRTLIFVGLAGGLGYWGLIASEQRPPPKERGKEPPLVTFDPAAVTKIETIRQGNPAVVERTPTGWTVTKPLRIQADPQKVASTLRHLATLRPKTRFGHADEPPIPDPALSGLDVPWATLKVYAGDAEPFITIEVGNESDFDRQSYAKVIRGKEERVMTLPPKVRSLLINTAEDYYDRRVLGANPADVIKLSVTPREPRPDRIAYVLQRPPTDPNRPAYLQKDRFDLVEPKLGRADSVVARKVLQGLVSTPATNFLTADHKGDLKRFGLDTPEWTITFWVRPPKDASVTEPIKRTVWATAPTVGDDGQAWVRVARSDQPWVAEVGPSFLSGLARNEAELVSKRLFDFIVMDVERIELSFPAKKKGGARQEASIVKVEKKTVRGTGWRFEKPKAVGARHEKIATLLLTFVNLNGTERAAFGDAANDPAFLKRTGLDEAARVMRFFDARGNKLGGLKVGKEEGDIAYVMAEDSPLAVKIPKLKLAELPTSFEPLMLSSDGK